MGIKRKTIAYLVRQVDDNVSNQIWSGIVTTAKELDINIIAFIGDVLGKNESNIAYELCNKKLFDGIITWATSETTNLSYFNKFNDIPLLSLSLEIPGHPVVSIDCYSGMKEALTHLINEHGYTKIAFIRGPENHIYAQERYNAYLDFHKEFNIKLDERMVTDTGSWDYSTGKEGIIKFLDERKLKLGSDIQAIACVNDYIAVGAIEELKKHGYKVPFDVAVIGFNNTTEAESFTPPITSVSMPYFEQGALAVKAIMDIIDGKTIEKKILLKSKLILQRSCGCKSAAIKHIESDKAALTFEKNILDKIRTKIEKYRIKDNKEVKFEDIKSYTADQITGRVIKYLGSKNEKDCVIDEMVKVLAVKFIDSFIESLEGDNNESFLNILEDILVFISEHECNVEAWHGAISILRENFLQTNKDIQKYLKAQDMFEQARVIISEVVNRFHIYNNLKANKKVQTIRQIGSKLITTFNLKKLSTVLSEGLQNLNFPGFYLVLYDKLFKYKFPDPIPDKVRLILAFSENNFIDFKEDYVEFLTSEIIPKAYFPKETSFRFALAPLHFDKNHMGYVILEAGPIEKSMYGAIVEQLSSALMGSLLMEERERTEEFLEETLDNLQKKAKVVSSHSQKISQRVDDVSAAVEEIAANIRQISTRTEEVMTIVRKAVEMASNANDVIKGLKEKSAKISEITNIINDIAEKTSILALNANIEAARARESGKGFKIVASEVKKLSVLTVKSTEEIKEIVGSIQSGSIESYEVIKNAVNVINKVSDLSDAIKEAVSQQVTATNDVANKLAETAFGSKEIFEAIREVAYTDENIENQDGDSTIAQQLKKLRKDVRK
ncbi:MAG: substrate-binding domain-containing protein [Spirochaetes bacterium]|nr:substrate-binding domain-containing protein [Spirochaetota bacterium]